jgi:hypothetical protein
VSLLFLYPTYAVFPLLLLLLTSLSSFTCVYSFISLYFSGGRTKRARCDAKARSNKFKSRSTGLVTTNCCLFSAFLLLIVPEVCSVVMNRIVEGVMSV